MDRKQRIPEGGVVQIARDLTLSAWKQTELPDGGVEVALAGSYRIKKGTSGLVVGRKSHELDVLIRGQVFQFKRDALILAPACKSDDDEVS